MIKYPEFALKSDIFTFPLLFHLIKETSIYLREGQSLNILLILVIFLSTKLDRLMDVNEWQPSNIESISPKFSVLKLDKFNEIKE